jgi:diguanylate cyclase (GGDEF)-like protein
LGGSVAESVDERPIVLKTIEDVEVAIKKGSISTSNYVDDFQKIAASYEHPEMYESYLNGIWLCKINKFDDALLEFQKALDLIDQYPNDYLEMLILEKLLEINEKYQDLISYQKNAMELRKLAAGVDDEIYIKAIYAIADIYYRTYNVTAARSYLTVIFQESKEIGYAYGLSRYHYLYGLIENSYANTSDAQYHFDKSYLYALDSDQILSYDYLDFLEVKLATIDNKNEDYERAYTRMTNLLAGIDKQSDYMKRDIYYQLGYTCYQLSYFDQALNYLNLALIADYEANTSYEVSTYSSEIYTMLGFVYDAKGDEVKSIESFKNANAYDSCNASDEIKLRRISELTAYELDELQKELAFKRKIKDANEETILLQRHYLKITTSLAFCLLMVVLVLIWMYYMRGQIQKRLYLETITDNLTKVFSRAYIIKILEQNRNRDTCILMMDIDDFKMINDTFGHVVGDKVLIRVANVIRKNLREIDAVGRYGGEEFLVVLKNTDLESGRLVAERIRAAVENIPWEEKIVTTISVGMIQSYDGDTDEILSEADILLYRAKSLGKNRVVF